MSSRNGGSPPLLAPNPTEVANINCFDLEQAMDEAAKERDVVELEAKAAELSVPPAPSVCKIFTPLEDDGEITCAGYDSDGNPPPFPSRSDIMHQEATVPNFSAAGEIVTDANDGAAENMCVLIENKVLQKMKGEFPSSDSL